MTLDQCRKRTANFHRLPFNLPGNVRLVGSYLAFCSMNPRSDTIKPITPMPIGISPIPIELSEITIANSRMAMPNPIFFI